jgi:hypothetical protein
MFDSLDEQMARDDKNETTNAERYMKWAVVAVASVVLFGGLYLGTLLLE